MSVKEKVSAVALNTAMNYVSGDPKKNLPKLLAWIDGIGWGENYSTHKKVFHEILDDPGNNWYRYIMNLWRDIDNEILKATFRNFGFNASMFGSPKQEANAEKYGCNIPWAILIDPTSACNLECTGCWAAEYPGALTDMVGFSGAYSSDLQNREDVRELSAKCRRAAEKWLVVADEL